MKFTKIIGIMTSCLLSVGVLAQIIDNEKWRIQSANAETGVVTIQGDQIELTRTEEYPAKAMLRAFQDVAVTPGTVYQLSYKIKVEGARGGGRATVYFGTKAGSWAKQRGYAPNMRQGDFTPVMLKLTAGDDIIKFRIDFRAFGTEAKVTYKEIKFEQLGGVKPASSLAAKSESTTAVPAKLKKEQLLGPANKSKTLTAIINAENSYQGKYSWQQYKTLLDELSKPRYKVVSLKDFSATVDSSKIIVAMRHDIDSHPEKALEMMDIELSYGLHSTYFFLHSAKYYGTVKNGVMVRNQGFDELVKDIYKNGFEVGIHTDLFTMMWNYQFDPVAFIKAEIAYYKQLGIPIIGSSAHGASEVIKRKFNNKWIFADFGKHGNVTVNGKIYQYGKYTLSDFGLKYEAYKLRNDLYTGDIDRKYKKLPDPVNAIITKLASLSPGKRVIILTHPEHWGKP